MITLRPAEERGRTRLDWLDSYHTFSFNEYYDPRHMGFRALRVINEDFVKAGAGFGKHGHRDMEILSYVLEGELEHRDSAAGGGVIRPGEIQFMRAGTGVTHSEYNQSKTQPVHFLQIWIAPATAGLAPAYGRKVYDREAARGGFALLASRDGRDGSIHLAQDADLHVTLIGAGERRVHDLAAGRHAWIQVARGSATVNDALFKAGDGAAASREPRVEIGGTTEAEVLLFDLA